MKKSILGLLCSLFYCLVLASSGFASDVFVSPVETGGIGSRCNYNDECFTAGSYHAGKDTLPANVNSLPDINNIGYGKLCTQTPYNLCQVRNSEGVCKIWQDHGFGNNILVKHLMVDGSFKYSLYAHMSSFAQDVGVNDWLVTNQKIGVMGGSGNDDLNYWTNYIGRHNEHLHFEIKDSAVIHNPSGTGTYWGYTPDHPDNYGYHNPDDYINQKHVLIPFLSRTTPNPSSGNYHVFGIAKQKLFGAMDLSGSYYSAGILTRKSFNRADATDSGSSATPKYVAQIGNDTNTETLHEVNGVSGNNIQYNTGDYLVLATLADDNADDEMKRRYGFPVKFSVLPNTHSVIIDNDQLNNGFHQYTELASDDSNVVPGYFLTSRIEKGDSTAWAQYRPDLREGSYRIWIHVPEIANAGEVEYKVYNSQFDELTLVKLEQNGQGGWVELITSDESLWELDSTSYVGLSLDGGNATLTSDKLVGFDAVKFEYIPVWEEVTQNIEVSNTRPSPNWKTRTMESYATITNAEDTTVAGTFRLVVLNCRYEPLNSDGTDDAGNPYVYIPNDRIDPGEAITTIIEFPLARRISFDLRLDKEEDANDQVIDLSYFSPEGSGNYASGQTETIIWETSPPNFDGNVEIGMKRDVVSDIQTEPLANDPNWFVFTNTAVNNGTHEVTIPSGLTPADDWCFYVKHIDSGEMDNMQGRFVLEGIQEEARLIDIGPPSAYFSCAVAINNSGQVVGVSAGLSGFHSFIWDAKNGMHNLGMPSSESSVFTINDLGQAVGHFKASNGDYHAFVWDSENNMHDLGTLGGSTSGAIAINNLGQVVGHSTTSNGDYRAFVWDSENGMHNLGTLGGYRSFAKDINDLGQVVGVSATSTYEQHAFIWDSVNGMRDLGTLGGSHSDAVAINSLGQVVGSAETSTHHQHAFIWDSVNGMRDLGTLGGSFSEAIAINNLGQVIGHYTTNGNDYRAFIWDSANGMRDLGTLGGSFSEAIAINNLGQVTGFSRTNKGDDHAFVWDSENGMHDLDTLGGPYSNAVAINDFGQIVGSSASSDGNDHAFVWGSSSPTCTSDHPELCTTEDRCIEAGGIWNVAGICAADHLENVPAPDIKVNNSDGPVVIDSNEVLSVTINLNPESYAGLNGDWWICAETPSGRLSYDLIDFIWITDCNISFEYPIISLDSFTILNSMLVSGFYRFTFGINLGAETWSDSVDVTIVELN